MFISNILFALRRVSRVLACWVLAGGALCEAEEPAPAARIRLLAFTRVGAEMEVMVTDAEGKPQLKAPLALPTQQLSQSQAVNGRSLRFASPKEPQKILGKVDLPASGREFLLIFLPNAKEAKEAYHVDAVALPDSDFGSGDYAFVNYSGRAVGCVIGGAKLLVPHGKATIYQMKISGKGVGPRSIVCYEQKDGKWAATPFFSSRIIIQEGVRTLVLICRDPRSGAIDFRGVADFMPKGTKAASEP